MDDRVKWCTMANVILDTDTVRDESVLVDTELLLGLWFICEILVDM